MKNDAMIGWRVLLMVVISGLTASAQTCMPGGDMPGKTGCALLCSGDGRILEWIMRDSRVLDEIGLEEEKKQGIVKRLFECQRKMIELDATIQKALVTQAELLSEVTTNESELIKNVEMLGDAQLKLAKLELGELTVLRKALTREQYAHVRYVHRQRTGMPVPGAVGGAMGGPGAGPMPAPMPGPMPGLMPPPSAEVRAGAAPQGLVIPAPVPPPGVLPGGAAPSAIPPIPGGTPKK